MGSTKRTNRFYIQSYHSPILEYASTIWSPIILNTIKKVQSALLSIQCERRKKIKTFLDYTSKCGKKIKLTERQTRKKVFTFFDHIKTRKKVLTFFVVCLSVSLRYGRCENNVVQNCAYWAYLVY